jgi:hypothetical protein
MAKLLEKLDEKERPSDFKDDSPDGAANRFG